MAGAAKRKRQAKAAAQVRSLATPPPIHLRVEICVSSQPSPAPGDKAAPIAWRTVLLILGCCLIFGGALVCVAYGYATGDYTPLRMVAGFVASVFGKQLEAALK